MSFFCNCILSILILIALIVIIFVLLLKDNFKDSNFRVPPHINQMNLQQLVPETNQLISSSNKSGEYIDPPNYNRVNQKTTTNNASSIPGNIYRMNTGRDAYQQEQFVSIYDSNFGGMLGTNMGL